MKIISIRENPEYKNIAIEYIQTCWPDACPVIYEDCINHSIGAIGNLPQWYLLKNKGSAIGCAGLVTNDFISRMDLYPWFTALYIDEKHRGNAYGLLLLEKAKKDTKAMGYKYLYLSTKLIGYYEKYGFNYLGQGYHPCGNESSIYETNLDTVVN